MAYGPAGNVKKCNDKYSANSTSQSIACITAWFSDIPWTQSQCLQLNLFELHSVESLSSMMTVLQIHLMLEFGKKKSSFFLAQSLPCSLQCWLQHAFCISMNGLVGLCVLGYTLETMLEMSVQQVWTLGYTLETMLEMSVQQVWTLGYTLETMLEMSAQQAWMLGYTLETMPEMSAGQAWTSLW